MAYRFELTWLPDLSPPFPAAVMIFPSPFCGASRSAGVLLAASALLLSGCASLFGSSGDDFSIDQGEIASYALPGTRDVSHPPDSLVHLQIVEKEGRLNFELDKSYREMLLEWTAGLQGGGRYGYFRTHATLWSKELSLASLIPERGVQTLSKDLAREMVRERTAEFDSLLQIDVYLFAPSDRRRLDLGDLQLDTPGKRVYLRDEDGNRYAPRHIDSSAPLEAFHAGQQALYGRNAIFFDRYTEEGKDLLDAEQLRLYVRPFGYYFTWELPQRAERSSSVARQ